MNLITYHAVLGYLNAGGLRKTILMVNDFLFISPRAFSLHVLVQEPKKLIKNLQAYTSTRVLL